MAGDWIKVEKVTIRKPEVMRIGEILGIHPDEAFGLCFRFWSWCDDHLTDGNARSVTEVTLDTLVNRSGFSKALLEVGWLHARNGSLVVPNFDRHLSQTAKNRSLTSQRVANHKKRKGNAPCVTNALPKEEKRREDIHLQESTPSDVVGNRFIPPTADEVKAYCRERKNTVDHEKFWNFYASKGWMVGKNKMKDWRAAVRNWESGNASNTGFTGGRNSGVSAGPGQVHPDDENRW